MRAGIEPERQLQAQVVNLGLVGLAAAERRSTRSMIALRCECGRRACRSHVLVTRAEYERLGRGFARLFVVPGHGAESGVLRHANDRFAVVDLLAAKPVLVEILSIEDCPYADVSTQLVELVALRLEVEIDMRSTVVDTPGAAARLRFLGSPTVRVNGVDVEPGAPVRCDFALGCRLYRTQSGPARVPAADWIGTAIAAAAGNVRGKAD
jgi:hypothetical protein